MVACRHFNGGDDVRCRHTVVCLRRCSEAGNRRELDLVGFLRRRHVDGVLFCAVLAPGPNYYRRAICGNSLRRQTCRISSRLQSHLPRPVHELLHPGMGYKSDGQHYHRAAWAGDCARTGARSRNSWAAHVRRSSNYRAGHLCFCADSVHGDLHVHRRTVGSAGHGPVSVCAKDGDDYCAGMGGCRTDWWNARTSGASANDSHTSECARRFI